MCAWQGKDGIRDMASRLLAAQTRTFKGSAHSIHNTVSPSQCRRALWQRPIHCLCPHHPRVLWPQRVRRCVLFSKGAAVEYNYSRGTVSRGKGGEAWDA